MDSVPIRCVCATLLKPPYVKVGWTPCRCDKAIGRPRGHQYTACTTCWREYRNGGCAVLVDGYDKQRDISGVALGGERRDESGPAATTASR